MKLVRNMEMKLELELEFEAISVVSFSLNSRAVHLIAPFRVRIYINVKSIDWLSRCVCLPTKSKATCRQNSIDWRDLWFVPGQNKQQTHPSPAPSTVRQTAPRIESVALASFTLCIVVQKFTFLLKRNMQNLNLILLFFFLFCQSWLLLLAVAAITVGQTWHAASQPECRLTVHIDAGKRRLCGSLGCQETRSHAA